MNISDLEQLIPTYVGPGQAKGNIVFRNGRVVANGVVLDGEGEDNVLQPTDWLSKVAVGSRCVVAILPGMRALVMGALGGGVSQGELDVGGDAYIDGSLETTGALDVGGDADITGSLKFGLENLSTHDLNDVTRGGFYRQGLTANATPEKNYPFRAAGLLEVFASGNMVWQRYTLYDNLGGSAGVYNRRRYNTTWSGWEELQKAAEPVSTALTLKNGWQTYGTGYQSPEYEVFPDGHVQLHGMIKPGTKTNNTVVATVPATLAPSNRRVFVVGAGQLGAARVDVNATGEIILAVFGAVADAEKVSWLSLETISW